MKSKEEIEQLAENNYPLELWSEEESLIRRLAFKKGYTKCQEDMADERKMIMETLLKIRDCKDYGNNSSTLAKELINSLNKQD